MASSPLRELEAISRVSARDRVLIAMRRAGGAGMVETPDKVAALMDATRALAAMGAPHALVGGVAVGVHSGVPRATADTGLAVLSTLDRSAVIQALVAAGLRLTGEFSHSVNFRHASGEPVQIVFDAGFDPMIQRAERLRVAGIEVPIVRKDDLIAMKERAAADPARRRSKALRDRADVELLRGDVPDPDEGW
jgi:hypothetical protein